MATSSSFQVGTSSVAFTLGLLVWTSLAAHAFGSAFLGRAADDSGESKLSPELERAVLSEIEEVLGSEHRRATEARLTRIESAMRPTFNALPKNEHGRLGHAAVRYGMHRFFVQRHGWYVKGLESKGESWNSSSPSIILKDRVSSDAQSIFETRLGQHGLDLHAMAVMAATIENQVHKEGMERLEDIYRALERSFHEPVSIEESHEVIDTYMAAYILGANVSAMSPEKVRDLMANIKKVYPTWSDTEKFTREVQTSIAPSRDELTYQNVGSIVEEIGERYGRWQHGECTALKNELVTMEDRGNGRVRLSEFYRAAVEKGSWQFNENIGFLRSVGALDESDPANPSVIIPNYINNPSNCIVKASAYYSVCCIDECEDILGHIEERLGTPEASTGEILAVVAALPSATVLGDRTLSPILTQRLDEVAAYHSGRIPLHGRLFAQWLHLAYPRECSYPHAAGTKNLDSVASSAASKQEMMQHIQGAEPPSVSSPREGARTEDEQTWPHDVDDRMWTLEEELLVVRPSAPAPVRETSSLAVLMRAFVFIAVFVSFSMALKQPFGATMSKKSPQFSKCESKYTV